MTAQCTHGQLARQSPEAQCPICERDALREAVPFAIGAIEDAIYLEEGLDGDAGQRVVHILREALERGTFDRDEYGSLPRPHADVALDAVRAALGMDADDEGNPVENIESIQADRDRLAAAIKNAPCPRVHPDQGGPCCSMPACLTDKGCDCWKRAALGEEGK